MRPVCRTPSMTMNKARRIIRTSPVLGFTTCPFLLLLDVYFAFAQLRLIRSVLDLVSTDGRFFTPCNVNVNFHALDMTVARALADVDETERIRPLRPPRTSPPSTPSLPTPGLTCTSASSTSSQPQTQMPLRSHLHPSTRTSSRPHLRLLDAYFACAFDSTSTFSPTSFAPYLRLRPAFSDLDPASVAALVETVPVRLFGYLIEYILCSRRSTSRPRYPSHPTRQSLTVMVSSKLEIVNAQRNSYRHVLSWARTVQPSGASPFRTYRRGSLLR
ncbi:hypothetical protein MSAN_02029300 [Mycena sanguinolenta]|uniref:Uncharacterized protein n=1 Tax=Mycena sanguinolenta TaxID=230812 RepID=A0A8H7CM15_9AGAR|nr:hypothetical protein MSAN_02029300 [Mycena sanguinolenta]